LQKQSSSSQQKQQSFLVALEKVYLFCFSTQNGNVGDRG
jgi:hypothetical protein